MVNTLLQTAAATEAWDSLVGLSHAVRLDVRVPVLLPAVALPARLALEGLQAHVFVHVLLEIFGFEELLVTAAGQVGKNNDKKKQLLFFFAGSVKRFDGEAETH